jgi:hypothetical protein
LQFCLAPEQKLAQLVQNYYEMVNRTPASIEFKNGHKR